MRSINLLSFLAALVFVTGCSSLTQSDLQPDPDQQVLDQMKAAGSDLNKPHKIDFYLYFPSEEKAKNAAIELRKEGMSVEVRPAATGSNWLCLGTMEIVPKHVELVRLGRVFEGIIKKLGGEYDGWESEIVR